MRAFISAFFAAFVLKTCICPDPTWCYDSQPWLTCKIPSAWKDLNPTCDSKKQSPIDISTAKAKPDGSLTPLKLANYDASMTFPVSISNSYQTVKVDVASGKATISGGGLSGAYKAVEFHFHWGDATIKGSEHTIDGQRFSMELHIVHMKDTFSNIVDALKQSDGIAVLGFFLKLGDTMNPKYDPIIKAIKTISTAQSTVDSAAAPSSISISLNDILPPDCDWTKYYRYSGSLTTPNCNEAVAWTIFDKCLISLSKEQLDAFYNAKTDGKTLKSNFRPLQQLNDRTVYYPGSGAVRLTSSTVLLLCLSMVLGLSVLN